MGPYPTEAEAATYRASPAQSSPIGVLAYGGALWRVTDRGTWDRTEMPAGCLHSVGQLGDWCTRVGVSQLWVHSSAYAALGFPPTIHAPRPGAGAPHPFTEARGEWHGGSSPGLRPFAYWWRKGQDGFDLHMPDYAASSPFAGLSSAGEMLLQVTDWHRATRGARWLGTGAITSDEYLRRTARIFTTEMPPGLGEGPVRLEAPARYHRAAEAAELARGARLFGFDQNLAYASPAGALELPIGEPVHEDLPGPPAARVPALWHVEDRDGARWVTTPTAELIHQRGGPHTFVEVWYWPNHGRYMRRWYEMLRDARAELLDTRGAALEAVKDTCRWGVGRLQARARNRGSEPYWADPLYQPYWAAAIIAEVRSRLWRRVEAMPIRPVAVDVDALYFISSRRSHEAVAKALGLPYGDGLSQYKPAGMCRASLVRDALASASFSIAIGAIREALH